MAIGTPTPAKRVQVGNYVVMWSGSHWTHLGNLSEIRQAPMGRLYMVGPYASMLVRPDSRVRVVG